MLHHPEAILLLFEPGRNLRSLKFWLFSGHNHISADPASTLVFPEAGNKSAKIVVENGIVTIADTSKDGDPWLQKQASLAPFKAVWLQRHKEYEILPERNFWMGKYRAMYKGDTFQNLRKMKNVLNSHLCRSVDSLTEKDQSNPTQHKIIEGDLISTLPADKFPSTLLVDNFDSTLITPDGIGSTLVVDEQVGSTLIVGQDCVQSTLLVGNYEQADPTLLMPNSVDSTLLVDDCRYQSTLITPQGMESTLLVDSRGPESTLLVDSLPQTIVDDDGLAATLYDEPEVQKAQQKPIINEIKGPSASKTEEIARLFSTQVIKKYKEKTGPESLFDLFEHPSQQPTQSTQQSKVQQTVQKLQVQRTGKKESEQQRVVCFSGFRPSENERGLARKMGLRVMEEGTDEFDLLLIKDLKLTNKLLIALIQNKPIFTKDYLYKKMARPFGKLQGWPWEEIIERSQSTQKHRLFQGEKFILHAATDTPDMRKICQLMGGVLLKRVPRVGKGNVIVGKKDKEFFQKHKRDKNLQFFGIGLLEESALLAEAVREKHRVDALFFQD